MRHYTWSDEVEEMDKQLEPYFSKLGGLVPDAPPEIQELYKKYKKKVEEEAWL